MAANVIIEEWNGTGGSETRTDKTSGTIRFKNADNATVDLINPLVVPGSGQEYSFEKWVRLAIAGGSFTQVDNLQVYTDGANNFGTGIKAWYAIAGTYMTPVIPNESNDPPQSPAAGSPQENMADLFGLTSGAPGDLDANNPGPYTDGSPQETIGDFIVMVMEVETTASNGVLTAETLTFSYDEI
ncbi:MAG: hypothetical protein ACE5JZ_06625 [Kiloniellales bacterium]